MSSPTSGINPASLTLTDAQERHFRQLLDLRRNLETTQADFRWVLLSACAVVEIAYAELLDDLVNDYLSQHSDAFTLARVEEARKRTANSWKTRLEWLGELGYVQDRELSERIIALVDVRNAVAHSGISFTPQQMANYSKFLELRTRAAKLVRLECSGGSIVVKYETANEAIVIARDAIAALPCSRPQRGGGC